jgi:cell division protein ZipA
MSSFELRIALIFVAVIVIAVMYIWYRVNSKDSADVSVNVQEFNDADDLKDIPAFVESDDQELLTEDLRSEFQGVSQQLREETITKRRQEFASKTTVAKALRDEVSPAKDMLVVINVAARAPGKFTGPMIMRMMEELELEHGEMGIYHYYVQRFDKKSSVYCIANTVKPGTFDMQTIESLATPGLSMILQLPGPEEGLKALNIMLEHAQRVATYLNGDLLDQNRNPLTPQYISALKEQVQLFSLRADRRTAIA